MSGYVVCRACGVEKHVGDGDFIFCMSCAGAMRTNRLVLFHELEQERDALLTENAKLLNLVEITEWYLSKKKSWDNTLRELVQLKAALREYRASRA